MARTGPKGYPSDPRERIRRLMAEGKMSPQHGRLGGRPRKRPASEIREGESAGSFLARAAADHREDLLRVLQDAIDSGQGDRVRLAALRDWLGVEERDVEREEKRAERAQDSAEAAAIASMNREQLLAYLASKIEANPQLAQVFLERQRVGAIPGSSERS